MEKNINSIPKNKINTKNSNKNKTLKINPVYFSIELIPYNKILNSIMICLQKKLSPKIFNDIYKYFIKEIKKYINKSSQINLIRNEINQKISTEKNKSIMDFGINKYIDIQKKKLPIRTNNINKKIKPLVGLSFSNKIDISRAKKNISISSFPNLNLNYLDIKKLYNNNNNYNYNNSFINNSSLNRTLNYTKNNFINNNTSKNNDKNSKSEDKKFNSKKKKKIILNDYKFIINDRLHFNKINLNNNQYNTINTSIHQNKMNNYLNINKEDKNQYLTNNIKKKISINRTLTNIPYQAFIDIVNKNNNKKKFKTNIIRNINNEISINNIQDKDNNNKLNIINIKLQKPKNNGGGGIKKSLQTSEEMLKHIKNSLDDDNLKGMLNFSYENFLSKESERESKEYNIEN